MVICRRNLVQHPQRRTFLGLQRTPAPNPHIQGLLVGQGLAVVLLIDYVVAAIQGEKTTLRSTLQFFGLWKDAPAFDTAHKPTMTNEKNARSTSCGSSDDT